MGTQEPKMGTQGADLGTQAAGRRQLKRVDVEKLLVWAYRDELPKLELSTPGGTGTFGSQAMELMTQVDCSGRAQFYAELYGAGPHPDALTVRDLVAELDDLAGEWLLPADDLLSDMPAEVRRAAAPALEAYGASRACLVARHARMASRPDWRFEPPERRVVCGANGKPAWFVARQVVDRLSFGRTIARIVEENGLDPKRRRPLPGAYRKHYFDPDPALILAARADYASWHASLGWLAEELGLLTTDHAPLPPAAAPMPWETGEASEPRVLASLAPGEDFRGAPRPLAGPTRRQGQGLRLGRAVAKAAAE